MLVKRITFGLVVLTGLLIMNHAVAAQEVVDNFSADIIVSSDGSFEVTETIVYDFGSTQRHGISRDIPYQYKRGGANYNIRIRIEAVVNAAGFALPYTTSRSGGEIHLKIGDPDIFVTGKNTYVISYVVARALNYFDDHHELYWNVTGNSWPVPINKAQATVTLPRSLTDPQRLKQCFTGLVGSTENDCSVSSTDDFTVAYNADTMYSGEGLTIVLGWPTGVTRQPSTWQQIRWFAQDNWPVALPIIVLIVMFYLWYTRGRDPAGRGTIIPIYAAPDKISPGLLGTVVDEKADLKDISASIIHLAVRGYLKIKEITIDRIIGQKTDYEFTKLKEPDESIPDFEKEILKGIFDASDTIQMSKLKNKFYLHLPTIKKSLYKLVVADGYFPTDPDKVRKVYALASIFITPIGFIIALATGQAVAGIAIGVSGVMVLIFSRYMPRKTKRGAEMHEKIMGFKWFLSVTEKDRLKFHQAPAKSPKEFEEFLPYAMVLGVEKEWAGQFADMYVTPPEWFEGSSGSAFGTLYMVSALRDMSTNFGSVAASRPGSAGSGGSGFGGGGFSGGGFGGGGGGSW